jgi:hypothetical protein
MSIAVEDWDDIAEAPREESRRRGRRRAKKQAAAEKAQPAPKQAPAAQKPAPAAQPVPAAEPPAPTPTPTPVAKKQAPAPAPEPVAKKPAPESVAERPAPEPEPEPAAEAPTPPAAKPKREQQAPAAKPEPALAPEVAPAPAVIAAFDPQDAETGFDDFDDFDRLNGVSDPLDERSDMPLRRRLRGRTPDAAPAAETWDAYAPEVDPAEAVIATAELHEVAASVDDWDELGDAPRRISIRGLTRAASSDSTAPARHGEPKEIDFGTAPGENLRLPLCLAAGNILIWLLARLSGVVELIGVSFAASVGMLLAAYVLREWQKDRSALIYLVGALPLPITIFALIA